jgi:hypothetical protein
MRNKKILLRTEKLCPICFSHFNYTEINDGDEDFLDKEREDHVRFHVESNDYLSNLATILSLMGDLNDKMLLSHRDTLRKICHELMFIQQHYKIVEK